MTTRTLALVPHGLVAGFVARGWVVTGRAHLYPHIWAHGCLMERM